MRYGPLAYEQPADSLSQAAYDQPDRGAPRAIYVICSQPRVGSTLLSRWLWRTGMLGVPQEYLHANAHMPFIARRLGLVDGQERVDVARYLETLPRIRATPNGVFGLKAHWDQAAPMLKSGAFQRAFAGARFVYLVRRDVLGQAISLAIALQTRQWTGSGSTATGARYDADQIERALAFILKQRQGWEHFFAVNGLEPLRLVYEEMAGASVDTVARIAGLVGVEGVDLPEDEDPPLARQRGELNREWRDRFVAERASMRTLATA